MIDIMKIAILAQDTRTNVHVREIARKKLVQFGPEAWLTSIIGEQHPLVGEFRSLVDRLERGRPSHRDFSHLMARLSRLAFGADRWKLKMLETKMVELYDLKPPAIEIAAIQPEFEQFVRMWIGLALWPLRMMIHRLQ